MQTDADLMIPRTRTDPYCPVIGIRHVVGAEVLHFAEQTLSYCCCFVVASLYQTDILLWLLHCLSSSCCMLQCPLILALRFPLFAVLVRLCECFCLCVWLCARACLREHATVVFSFSPFMRELHASPASSPPRMLYFSTLLWCIP